MIPQHFPLYAVDTRTNHAYVVIGWRGWPTDTSAVPVLAPMDGPGKVTPLDAGMLAYGTEPPIRNMSTPAPDETVVLRPLVWPPR